MALDAPVKENSEMTRVVIYTTRYCPYCTGAKALLRSKNIEFEEIDVTDHPAKRAEMEHLSQRWTVPQIFIDGQPIGGFDDLNRLDLNGMLDPLLAKD